MYEVVLSSPAFQAVAFGPRSGSARKVLPPAQASPEPMPPSTAFASTPFSRTPLKPDLSVVPLSVPVATRTGVACPEAEKASNSAARESFCCMVEPLLSLLTQLSLWSSYGVRTLGRACYGHLTGLPKKTRQAPGLDGIVARLRRSSRPTAHLAPAGDGPGDGQGLDRLMTFVFGQLDRPDGHLTHLVQGLLGGLQRAFHGRQGQRRFPRAGLAGAIDSSDRHGIENAHLAFGTTNDRLLRFAEDGQGLVKQAPGPGNVVQPQRRRQL